MGKTKLANCNCKCTDCEKCDDCGQKCCNRIKVPSDRRRGRTTLDTITRGPRGPVGPRGPQGDMGTPGSPGPSGPQGPTGALGPSGPMGIPGGMGTTGSQGASGVQGPTGLQGATGIQGQTGPTGVFDDDICDLFDQPYTECSRTFDFSDPGCPVPSNFLTFDQVIINPGAGDEQVFDFAPPLSTAELNDFLLANFGIFQIGPDTWKVSLPSDVNDFSLGTPSLGSLLVTTSVTESVFDILVCGESGPGRISCDDFLGRITAPTGLRGPTGFQGMTGAQGMDGAAVMMGDTGAQGPTGLQGMTGPQGAQGVDGSAAMIGDTGPQGPTGLQGGPGVTGAQGLQGFQGETGITGPTGMNNMIRCGPLFMGITAINDAAKPIPAPAGTQIGDFCLNLDTGALHEWDGATWQIVNPQPDRPYFYFDIDTTLIYELTGLIGPPTLLPFKLGDLILTEDGSGQIFIAGATGWGICDLNGDLCTRLEEVSIDCLGDVSITGPTARDYLCFQPTGGTGGGEWINSPITLTVESATTATGPASTSTSIDLPDTIRFFSVGGIITITTPGSAVVEIEPANLLTDTTDPTTSLPAGPTDPSRPVVYANSTTNQLFWWDPVSASWQVIVPELNHVGDVDVSGATAGHYLCFTGGQWVSSPIKVDDLCDTDVDGATAGDYLCFSDGLWISSPIKLDDLCDTDVAGATSGEYLCFTGGKWISTQILLDDLGDVVITDAATGDYIQFDGSVWVNGPPRIGNEIRCGDFFQGLTADDAGSKPAPGGFPEGTFCLTLNTGTLFVRNAGGMWEIVDPQPDRPYFYLDTSNIDEMYELNPPGPTGPPVLLDPENGDTIFTTNGPESTFIFGATGWDVCGDLCNKLESVSIDCLGDVEITDATGGDYLCFTGGEWVNAPIDFKKALSLLFLDDLGDVTVPTPMNGEYLCFTGGEWVSSPINVADLGDTVITNPVDGEYLCFTGGVWVNGVVPRANFNRCGDLLSGITADDAGSKPLVGPFVVGDFCLTLNTGTLFEWDGATWQIVNPQPDRPFFYLDIDTGILYELNPPGPTGPPSMIEGQDGDVLFTTNGPQDTYIHQGPSGWTICGDLCQKLDSVSIDCLGDVNVTGASGGDYLCFDDVNDEWIASSISLTIEAGPTSTGPPTTSTTIDLPDTIRFISDGGIISVVSAGSAIVKLDPNNLLTGATGPTNAFPSGPDDPSRPAFYNNNVTNQLFFWDPVLGAWNVIVPALDHIGDVNVPAPSNNEYLCFTGGVWINQTLDLSDNVLDDLGDVSVAGATTGEYLCFSGGEWINAIIFLNDLGDVTVPAPMNNEYLCFTGGMWISQILNLGDNVLDDLGDVEVAGATAGEYLCFDGTNWVNEIIFLNDLGDVTVPAPMDGEYLCFTGGEWINAIINLNDLGDVTVPAPMDGEYLCFTGGEWISQILDLSNNVLNDLGDVEVGGATAGEYLCFDGTNWVNQVINLNDLGDTVITSPTGGEYLCFTGGVWVNSVIPRQGNVVRCGDFFSGITADDAGSKPLVGPMVVGDLCLTLNTGTLFEWNGATWEIVNPQPDRPYFYLDEADGEIYELSPPGPTGPPDLVVAQPGDIIFTSNGAGDILIRQASGTTGWLPCGTLCDQLDAVTLDCIGDVNVAGATTGDCLCFTGGVWEPTSLMGLQGFQGHTGAQGSQGFQGHTGAQGSQGFQGHTGAQGSQGFQGHTGAQGSQGFQGHTGAQGSQGFQGHTGAQGSQGFQGHTGAQGSQGFQGHTGAQGSQGFQGHTGAQGSQGFQGHTGAQGSQGFQGHTGAQGSQGFQGHTGAQGSQGFQGHTGAQGSQGFQGHTGAQGSQGFQGHTGAQGSQGFQGHTGAQGSQGFQGHTGAQGSQGFQGHTGAQGNQGFLGGTGAQGSLGFQGSTGAQGSQGLSGSVARCGDFFSGITSDDAGSKPLVGSMVVGDLCLTLDTGTLFEWNGATWEIVNPQPDRPYFYQDIADGEIYELNPPGPTGPPALIIAQVGDIIFTSNGAGDVLIRQATGMTGWLPCGTLCEHLDAVTLGCIGDVNVAGATTGDCLCFTGGVWEPTPIGSGNQGFQGATGAQGFQGVPGSAAMIGDTGAQGAQGFLGPTGAQGFQGVPGSAAMIGDTGAQGNQGFIGATGAQGFQGVPGSAAMMGDTGAQGAQGFQGFTGAQGSQGFQGHTGAQGSQGFQGHTGAQGSQGFQGSTGAQGSQGFQGATGAQGSQGFQGATGAQGSQGFQGASGAEFLNDLLDVDVPSPTGGECLCFTGGTWVATAVQSPISGPPFEVIAINDAGTGPIPQQDQVIMASTSANVISGTLVTSISSSSSIIEGTGSSAIATSNSSILSGITGTTGINGAGTVINITGAGVSFNSVVLGGKNLKNIHENAVVTGEEYQSHANNSLNVGGRLYLKDVDLLTIGTGATAAPFTPIPGPQGFQGFQGNTGGSQGFQGSTGAQGGQGFQGFTGAQGSQGFQGHTGAQGAQGFQGHTGAQGSQGFQGHTGAQGAQGFQGHTGAQGSQGFQGHTGAQGSQGFQGNTGTVPSLTLSDLTDVDATGATGGDYLCYNGNEWTNEPIGGYGEIYIDRITNTGSTELIITARMGGTEFGDPLLTAATGNTQLFDLWDTNGVSSGTTPDHTVDSIIVTQTGIYSISLRISADVTSTNGFWLFIFRNDGVTNTPLGNLSSRHGNIGSGSQNTTVSGIASLTAGDEITFRMGGLNVSADTEADVYSANLSIIKIG